jgi:hypothetical protein
MYAGRAGPRWQGAEVRASGGIGRGRSEPRTDGTASDVPGVVKVLEEGPLDVVIVLERAAPSEHGDKPLDDTDVLLLCRMAHDAEMVGLRERSKEVRCHCCLCERRAAGQHHYLLAKEARHYTAASLASGLEGPQAGSPAHRMTAPTPSPAHAYSAGAESEVQTSHPRHFADAVLVGQRQTSWTVRPRNSSTAPSSGRGSWGANATTRTLRRRGSRAGAICTFFPSAHSVDRTTLQFFERTTRAGRKDCGRVKLTYLSSCGSP